MIFILFCVIINLINFYEYTNIIYTLKDTKNMNRYEENEYKQKGGFSFLG